MLEDGIYFNLPAAEYHADKALGSTSIKAIALDPVDWQYDRRHPVERESLPLIWGSGLHARALEGAEAFKRQFCVAPDEKDYPRALKTMDDMRTHARAIGVKGGRTKAEVAALIRQHDPDAVIWDDIIDEFNRLHAGQTIISPKVCAEIEQAAQWMQADQMLSHIMEDGTMTAGCSEVSIFITIDGVRLKCRLDHLLPHAIIDLKSFRVQRMDRLERAALRALARERYDLQAADYFNLFHSSKPLFESGKVFGADDKAMEILKRAYAQKDLKWIWVLVKNSGAPQPLVRELETKSFLFGTAREEVNRAIDSYRKMRDKFGEDRDWVPEHPCEILDDTSFPGWAFM